MDCNCTTYICLTGYHSACSTGVKTTLLAPFTGNGTFYIEFNGLIKQITVAITQGDYVILPSSSLNANYTHTIKFFNDSTLVGCYKLNITPIATSQTYTPPLPTPTGFGGKGYDGNDTNTQQFPELSGKTLLTLEINGQSYTKDFWTQTGTIVTWKDISQTFTGYIVLNWTS